MAIEMLRSRRGVGWSLKRWMAVSGHVATTVVFVLTSIVIAYEKGSFIPWQLFLAYALTSPLWYAPELAVTIADKIIAYKHGRKKDGTDKKVA